MTNKIIRILYYALILSVSACTNSDDLKKNYTFVKDGVYTNAKATYLDQYKNYLKTSDVIYYSGSVVTDVGFLADKNQLFFGKRLMEIDDLCWYPNLDKHNKISLLKKFFNGKNANIQYCNKVTT